MNHVVIQTPCVQDVTNSMQPGPFVSVLLAKIPAVCGFFPYNSEMLATALQSLNQGAYIHIVGQNEAEQECWEMPAPNNCTGLEFRESEDLLSISDELLQEHANQMSLLLPKNSFFNIVLWVDYSAMDGMQSQAVKLATWLKEKQINTRVFATVGRIKPSVNSALLFNTPDNDVRIIEYLDKDTAPRILECQTPLFIQEASIYYVPEARTLYERYVSGSSRFREFKSDYQQNEELRKLGDGAIFLRRGSGKWPGAFSVSFNKSGKIYNFRMQLLENGTLSVMNHRTGDILHTILWNRETENLAEAVFARASPSANASIAQTSSSSASSSFEAGFFASSRNNMTKELLDYVASVKEAYLNNKRLGTMHWCPIGNIVPEYPVYVGGVLIDLEAFMKLKPDAEGRRTHHCFNGLRYHVDEIKPVEGVIDEKYPLNDGRGFRHQ